MAINATSTGKIRPKNTQTRIHADGSADSVTWVREATVIKRIRRKLAERNHSLLITREGTHARRELGLYAVLDADKTVIERNADLAKLARFLGVLAPLEMIDPPLGKGWKFFVARQKRVVIDGITCWDRDQLTAIYTTEKAARKAAEGIVDRENLIIVGYDATIRESRHDA